jgi:hypothetical protein
VVNNLTCTRRPPRKAVIQPTPRPGQPTCIQWPVQYPAAKALTGAKIVPGTFGMVPVAAALPKDRSAAAQALLATLLDEAKQTGVVQKAIDAKGLKGVNVVTK